MNTLARKLPSQPAPEVQEEAPAEQPLTRVDFAAIEMRVGKVIIENWTLAAALEVEQSKNTQLAQENLFLQERLAKEFQARATPPVGGVGSA